MPPIVEPYRGVWPRIDTTVYVADSATIIGDAEIGAHSSLWPGVVIRSDVKDIRSVPTPTFKTGR